MLSARLRGDTECAGDELAVKELSQSVKLQFVFVLLIALLAFYNFLFFHVVAEGFCIFVAFYLVAVALRCKALGQVSFFVVLCVTLGSVAIVDLLHTFAYKGMGVLPVQETNVATQCWILGRYLLAFGLLLATGWSERTVRFSVLLPVGLGFTISLLVTVFTGYFPDAYGDGIGLTKFKVLSEYVIISLLMLTILLLGQKKVLFFDEHLLLIFAIGLTIVSELMFTLYHDVYSGFNLLGHLLKLVAYLAFFNLFQRRFRAECRDDTAA